MFMTPLSAVVERLVRSRMVRLALALVLIVVGIWTFLPHVVYRIPRPRSLTQSLFASPRR